MAPARTRSASVNDPVVCLIQPMVNGAMKPPRLPKLLTSAMPPATAAPVRKVPGTTQNTV